MLEFIVREGIADDLADEMTDDAPDASPKPKNDNILDDDDIPPRQKGFWE